jgi:hypothetical protein
MSVIYTITAFAEETVLDGKKVHDRYFRRIANLVPNITLSASVRLSPNLYPC